jgi:membrane glycosyltransferase
MDQEPKSENHAGQEKNPEQYETQYEQPNFRHLIDKAAPPPVGEQKQDDCPATPPSSAQALVSPLRTWMRRFFFFGAVILTNLVSIAWLADLFHRMGWHVTHTLLLLVFSLLNGLLVLGSFHALVGVWDRLFFWRAVRVTKIVKDKQENLEQRFAVVMPVYNEDIVKVCSRVEAIYRSIDETGHLASFDFFILSDTTQLDLWVEEEVAWTNLCRKLNAFGKVFYRRRRINENRKAGNIGDFIKTWGGHYEGMLVLDADSLMDGRDIVTMARTMEAHPKLGILQTPPKLIRGTSVFTRLQQFAMRLYGPVFIRGLNYWQLGQGSYWGHNAMIRVRPFSEFCDLPALPGKEPFGGKILSHDFVEAALMVKAGWEVWLAWDIEGTYEEAPPTLIDHLKRDRRWCQGNLQHMWLVFARRFPFASRAHLFMGIMAYLGSPIWFLFMMLQTWVAWDFRTSELSRLPFDGYAGKYLGLSGDTQASYLTMLVLFLLFSPKFFSYLGIILLGVRRKGFGNLFTLTLSFIMEMLLSALLAPSVMISHTLMVLGMFLGRSVNWGSQNRETDGTGWGEAFRYHSPATLIGLVWTIMAYTIGWSYMIFMSPILVGLVFAAPLSVWTSRSRYGNALLRKRILVTPEELHPSAVMLLADSAHAAEDLALTAKAAQRSGVIAAIVDPYVNGVHVSLLEPSLENTESPLVERWLTSGPAELTKAEMTEVMYNSQSMLMMHRGVWSRPFEQLHPVWSRAVESYRVRQEEQHKIG